jgi:hypothetical protein
MAAVKNGSEMTERLTEIVSAVIYVSNALHIIK